MSEKKPDRRVLKTKRAIRRALAQLLSEKNLDEITVKDVAETADINRKTFYNYYNGIHQVIDEIENEMIGACDWAIQDLDIRRDIQNPYGIFKKLNAIFSSDLDFFSYLFKMRDKGTLAYKLVDLLKVKSREAFLQQIPYDEKKMDILIDYMVTGLIAVYQTWFNSDRSQSLEEISDVLSVVCVSGLAGALDLTD